MDVSEEGHSEQHRGLLVNPKQLRTRVMVSNAMEPEIQTISRIVYLPTDELTYDGPYLFKLDGAPKVMYIQRYAGGALHLIPCNPLYKRELLEPVKGEANLFRSRRSGLVGRFEVVGVVLSHQPLD